MADMTWDKVSQMNAAQHRERGLELLDLADRIRNTEGLDAAGPAAVMATAHLTAALVLQKR